MKQNYLIKNSGNKIQIFFSGDIDDSICPVYRKEISEYIKNNKAKDYIFDFTDVSFIDSSGIGFIIGRYNQLKGYHKKLYLSGVSNQLRKLFKISGLYTLISEIETAKVGDHYE